MSLHNINFHFPLLLAANETKSFVLEDSIDTARFILYPVLRYYNSITADTVDLTITHTLEVGFGDDPLNSATFSKVVLSASSLGPNDVQDYVFTIPLDLDTLTVKRHTVSVTSNSSVQQIVRFVLYGYTEVDTILPGGSTITKSIT